jgi:hypothetical protein
MSNSRSWSLNMLSSLSNEPVPSGPPALKKDLAPEILLAQDQEIQQLLTRFQANQPDGLAVQQMEVLVRTVLFKSANALVGWLLQQAADQVDAAYQPQPGQHYKGRGSMQVEGMFGSFSLERDYYYHEGKKRGHYPADAALVNSDDYYSPVVPIKNHQ